VPETSTDLVKDPDRWWRAEFAKRLDMPSMSGGPWSRSAHRPTAEPAPNSAWDRVRVELGGAWTSPEISSSRVRFRPALFVFLT
jgi:hypothetical protein